MVDDQIRPTETDEPAGGDRRRWVPYTILAAAAVLVVVIAVTLFDSSEQSAPIDTVDSPDSVVTPEPGFGAESALEVVEDYFAAREAGDGDAVSALFTPGIERAFSLCAGSDCSGTGGEIFSSSVEEHAQYAVWAKAEGRGISDLSCEPTATSATAEVTIQCTSTQLSGVSRVVGAPALNVIDSFVVSPEGIELIEALYDGFDLSAAAFASWVELVHPEDSRGTTCCRNWISLEDAHEGGVRAAAFAPEWAAWLEERGCTYEDVAFASVVIGGDSEEAAEPTC